MRCARNEKARARECRKPLVVRLEFMILYDRVLMLGTVRRFSFALEARAADSFSFGSPAKRNDPMEIRVP
jgi:hypothetical protein